MEYTYPLNQFSTINAVSTDGYFMKLIGNKEYPVLIFSLLDLLRYEFPVMK